jgi:hypothetical protein
MEKEGGLPVEKPSLLAKLALKPPSHCLPYLSPHQFTELESVSSRRKIRQRKLGLLQTFRQGISGLGVARQHSCVELCVPRGTENGAERVAVSRSIGEEGRNAKAHGEGREPNCRAICEPEPACGVLIGWRPCLERDCWRGGRERGGGIRSGVQRK